MAESYFMEIAAGKKGLQLWVTYIDVLEVVKQALHFHCNHCGAYYNDCSKLSRIFLHHGQSHALHNPLLKFTFCFHCFYR